MTFQQALIESRKTGRSFRSGGTGWFKYEPGWVYRLTFEELTRDDYELYGPAEGRPEPDYKFRGAELFEATKEALERKLSE